MEEGCKSCRSTGGDCQKMMEACAAGTDNRCEQCGCSGAGHEQDCGSGCGSAAQGGCECQGTERAFGGCAGGCPRAAGNEFQWDYDDTVLVFSSDMLEETDRNEE